MKDKRQSSMKVSVDMLILLLVVSFRCNNKKSEQLRP